MGEILVLRLGHRVARDKRITTHVCLVARAFGADGCVISGEYDPKLLESINDVVRRWGGLFRCVFEKNWKSVLKKWKSDKKSIIVHLTMYGINLPDIIDTLREKYIDGYNILVVVGAEKVPWEVFDIADFNVAIGNQPHSEVAALAVFLDWLFRGKELRREFENAAYRIVPQAKGKKVVVVNKEK